MGRDTHGNKHPNWKGGRYICPRGWVMVHIPGHHLADCRGYVYEHRLIAEKILGRSLNKGEIVHHIDGNKQNNDESNILVLTHAQHSRLHRLDEIKRGIFKNPNIYKKRGELPGSYLLEASPKSFRPLAYAGAEKTE